MCIKIAINRLISNCLGLSCPSGDVLKFQNFWDQFEAAVHDNDDLPNFQKFTYLRSVLTGNALQTIDGFEVTGANYQPAVECLKHRYGRKRVLISSLVKSVVQIDAKSLVTALWWPMGAIAKSPIVFLFLLYISVFCTYFSF